MDVDSRRSATLTRRLRGQPGELEVIAAGDEHAGPGQQRRVRQVQDQLQLQHRQAALAPRQHAEQLPQHSMLHQTLTEAAWGRQERR